MNIIEIIKSIAVLIAAAVIGNWFLSELKKTRAQRKPAYRAYLTMPGILIMVAIIFLPILMWMIKK